jgi:Protein of unknown function (DUF1573)
MKRFYPVILLFAFSSAIFAQPMIKVSAPMHDFGKFREEAGPQKFNFDVVNTGNSPLVIQNIVASCGCTTPEWTKSPIPPNGKGVITAIYDPANRPGPFEKNLTVYSNAKPEVIVLVIKGEVTAREKTVEDLYVWPVGGVRFETNHMAFTNVKKTEKKMRILQVINTSKEPVKIEFEGTSPGLKMKSNPETLKPGQKGMIEATYDATLNPGWGQVGESARIKLNGVSPENAYIYVSANLVEDFSSLTKDELANPPVFKLESTTVDLGMMEPAQTKDVEFRFTNAGKRDLILRNIRATCGCTAVQQGGNTTIKPGESSVIKASFNSGGYKGKVTKAIYVYTNDPNNSEVLLMLNADIAVKEEPGK